MNPLTPLNVGSPSPETRLPQFQPPRPLPCVPLDVDRYIARYELAELGFTPHAIERLLALPDGPRWARLWCGCVPAIRAAHRRPRRFIRYAIRQAAFGDARFRQPLRLVGGVS